MTLSLVRAASAARLPRRGLLPFLVAAALGALPAFALAQTPKPAAPAPQKTAPSIPAPPQYLAQFLVAGSHFHGVQGLAFDRDDQLYAGSVVGQAIYKIEADTGEVEIRIPAPEGAASDIAFASDGSMAWAAPMAGTVYGRPKPDQPIKVLGTGLPDVNSLAYTKDGRLFASQVFGHDALWEIDPAGAKPPRKVLENLGGLRGFQFGPDGLLYGPLWSKGEVVKIDVDKAVVTKVADGFKIPAAVSFDSKGRLYVVDSARGQVVRVDVDSGQKTLIATVHPSIDNAAVDSRDRLFITNASNNGIYVVDTQTGQARTVVEGKLAMPGDIAVWSDGKTETVHVADLFAYRTVDGATGEVGTVLRQNGDELNFPLGISVGSKHVVLTSWFTNTVQIVDRATGKPGEVLHDFKAPSDALELDDGSLAVLEGGSGSLLRVKGAKGTDRSVIAKDFNVPVALASAGGGNVYVSELGSGTIVRVNLANGIKTVVASGLKGPEGLDVAPDGRIIVAEVGARRVVSIDPKTGTISPIAENLAIGLAGYKGAPQQFVTTGVAVGKSGAIYVSSDVKNAIYKLTPE